MDGTSDRMDNQKTLDVSNVQNPDVTHEQSDVSTRGILAFAFGLFIVVIITQVLLWWMFDYFAVREKKLDQPLSPLVSGSRESQPPEPRLQVSPAQDLQEMRAAEDTILHSYGWVDRQAGVVRIPVERALQLLAERGLPARPESEDRGKR